MDAAGTSKFSDHKDTEDKDIVISELRGAITSLAPGDSADKHLLVHSLQGQVSRRRPMSKRKTCLDVIVQEQAGEQKWIVNLEVDAGRIGEEKAARVRDVIKVGDIVSVTGYPHRPLHDLPNVLGRILCASVQLIFKWDPQVHGHYQPPKLTVHSNTTRQYLDQNKLVAQQEDLPVAQGRAVLSSGISNTLEGWSYMVPSERAALDGDASVPLCKAWINSGHCVKGDACKYRHSTLGVCVGKARAEWVREQKRMKREGRAEVEGDVCNDEKQVHRFRASVFANWIAQTFAQEILEGQTLDVAGGRGDLAWELWVVRGIKAIVIDPRPPKLSKNQHRELRDIAARGGACEGYGDIQGLLAECRKRQAGEPCCCAKTLLPQKRDLFDASFWDDPSNAALLQSCSLIVGLHPDQATEPIVDYALRAGKSFAVVPCCVFGKENPHRTLPGGRSVSSYEDFVEYLVGKGEGIEKVFLPMDGKNLCLFFRGRGQS